jgi:hypothetical protein
MNIQSSTIISDCLGFFTFEYSVVLENGRFFSIDFGSVEEPFVNR